MTLIFDGKLTQNRELEKLQHERKQTWHGLGFRVIVFCVELQKNFLVKIFSSLQSPEHGKIISKRYIGSEGSVT